MDDLFLEQLVIKQLSGESSPQEDALIQEWVESSAKNRNLFLFYKATWDETASKYENAHPDQVFEKISSVISSSTFPGKKTIFSHRRIQMPMFVRAASVLLIVAFGVVLWGVLRNHPNNPANLSQQIIEKEAGNGQKLKTFLPDGSIAWLNAGSKISYAKDFSDSSRLITLEGEAYFEVEKDALRPFVVQTQNVNVIALGTAFDVRSYPQERDVLVALENGSVLVKMDIESNSNDQVVLKPGNGIKYNSKSKTFEATAVDPDNAYNWKDGVLYFKNASFDQVIKELERWYGSDIEVRHYNGDTWDYTAKFHDFSLAQVLKSMAFTKNFKYQIHQHQVIIDFKK